MTREDSRSNMAFANLAIYVASIREEASHSFHFAIKAGFVGGIYVILTKMHVQVNYLENIIMTALLRGVL